MATRGAAAELLDQADRLTRFASELQNEARRFNAALEDAADAASVGSRRRVSEGRGRDQHGSRAGRAADLRRRALDDHESRDYGTSREEILELMRNELGLEDAEAILDRLTI